MKQAVISGTGLYTPAQSISNEELVSASIPTLNSSTPTTPPPLPTAR
jgi:3-oxoacyl-[acyl-carrier-protein] synthase III